MWFRLRLKITLNFLCNLDFEFLFEIYFEIFKFELDLELFLHLTWLKILFLDLNRIFFEI